MKKEKNDSFYLGLYENSKGDLCFHVARMSQVKPHKKARAGTVSRFRNVACCPQSAEDLLLQFRPVTAVPGPPRPLCRLGSPGISCCRFQLKAGSAWSPQPLPRRGCLHPACTNSLSYIPFTVSTEQSLSEMVYLFFCSCVYCLSPLTRR